MAKAYGFTVLPPPPPCDTLKLLVFKPPIVSSGVRFAGLVLGVQAFIPERQSVLDYISSRDGAREPSGNNIEGN